MMNKLLDYISIILILIMFLLTFAFISCKSTEYIEVPIIKKEYIHNIDSIYIKDSIYINEKQKGDTILIETFKYRDRYKERIDTIYKTDTIYKPKVITQIKEVKIKENNSLNRFLSFIGLTTILGILLSIIIKAEKNRRL